MFKIFGNKKFDGSIQQAKVNVLNLEKTNQSIEEGVDMDLKTEKIREATLIEDQLGKIESSSGLSGKELVSIYESIDFREAKLIVEKAIQDIPDKFKKDVSAWSRFNLQKIGGKIIGWASTQSPERAILIVASVMVLITGSLQSEELNVAKDNSSKAKIYNDKNSFKDRELKQVVNIKDRLKIQKNFKDKIKQLGTFRDLPAAIFFVYGRNNYNSVEQIIKEYGQPIVVCKNGEMGEVLEKYLNRLIMKSDITAKELDELIDYAKKKNSGSKL